MDPSSCATSRKAEDVDSISGDGSTEVPPAPSPAKALSRCETPPQGLVISYATASSELRVPPPEPPSRDPEEEASPRESASFTNTCWVFEGEASCGEIANKDVCLVCSVIGARRALDAHVLALYPPIRCSGLQTLDAQRSTYIDS